MTKNDIKVLVEDLRLQRGAIERKEKALKSREEELKTRLEKASKISPLMWPKRLELLKKELN